MDAEINWNGLIKNEARGNDHLDLGEVQEVEMTRPSFKKALLSTKFFTYLKV